MRHDLHCLHHQLRLLFPQTSLAVALPVILGLVALPDYPQHETHVDLLRLLTERHSRHGLLQQPQVLVVLLLLWVQWLEQATAAVQLLLVGAPGCSSPASCLASTLRTTVTSLTTLDMQLGVQRSLGD